MRTKIKRKTSQARVCCQDYSKSSNISSLNTKLKTGNLILKETKKPFSGAGLSRNPAPTSSALKRLLSNMRKDRKDIYYQFKGACAARGLSMSIVMRVFMETFVTRPQIFIRDCETALLKETRLKKEDEYSGSKDN